MKKEDLESIIRGLNEAGVRYLLAGGLAVVCHGHVRFTHHVDLVLDMQDDNLRKAVGALKGMGYKPLVPVNLEDHAVESKRRMWIEQKNAVVLNLMGPHPGSVGIDVMLKTPFSFDDEYAVSSVLHLDIETSAPTISLPTLLAMKRPQIVPRTWTILSN